MKFIAEVSSNHNRDLARCKDFVQQAAAVGCDAVKFQLFKIEELFAPELIKNREDIRLRKQWELPVSFVAPIAEYCREFSIKFGCTPFYLKAVEELFPYVDFYKIASYELLWSDLLKACAVTGKPVIISTGMATMDEITQAVQTLKENGCTDLTILHCVSGYPAPVKDCNLAAIETLRKNFGCFTGWSDHSVNPGVIQRSIHRWGAEVIEFHLDIDGKGREYEIGHCWTPIEIGSVISSVKEGISADGDGVKSVSASEINEREWRADPVDGLRPLSHIRKSF